MTKPTTPPLEPVDPPPEISFEDIEREVEELMKKHGLDSRGTYDPTYWFP